MPRHRARAPAQPRFRRSGRLGDDTRHLVLGTGTSQRWTIAANASNEAGTNAGSDLVIARYSDTGASLGTALTIMRGTGAATFATDLTVNGVVTATGGFIGDGSGLTGVGLPALAAGRIWVGSGANAATAVTLSGDCALSSAGAITCTKTSGTSLGALATASSVSLSTQATGTLQAAQFPALTGDVTTSAGSLATAIGAGRVTNAMLAGGIDLGKLATTGTASSSTYLRGDGAWTAPAAGAAGSNTQLQYNAGGALAGAAALTYAATGALLTVTAQAATDKPLVVKAAASQSGNLQEWQASGGTALAVVTGTGNIGIGTTSPATRLYVDGNATGGAYMATIDNSSYGASGSNGLRVTIDRDLADSTILAADAGGATKMVVRGDGNVGLGTTSPAERLDLAGGNVKMGYEQVSNTITTSGSVSCSAGKQVLGGGCNCGGGTYVRVSIPNGVGGWLCYCDAGSGNVAWAICANIK